MELHSSVFLHHHLRFCSINLCVMKFVKWEISEHYRIILTLFWHWLTGSSKWTNAWNWTSLNVNNDMDFGLNWVWNFFIYFYLQFVLFVLILQEKLVKNRVPEELRQPTGRVIGIIKRKWRQYCGILQPSILKEVSWPQHRILLLHLAFSFCFLLLLFPFPCYSF